MQKNDWEVVRALNHLIHNFIKHFSKKCVPRKCPLTFLGFKKMKTFDQLKKYFYATSFKYFAFKIVPIIISQNRRLGD